jgi:serine/threonine-protein kinase HipA
MNLSEIKYCPGTLKGGHKTYSQTCLRRLYNGRLVSHILPYNTPKQDEEVAKLFQENRKRISISGVQEKLSFILDKNKLRLTKENEQGTHILKPIPVDLRKVSQVPANEHVTMQIARQVYHINTAENGMIFFKNGEPAYITKRFDLKPGVGKWGKEDFASLAGKTSVNAGENFKYDYSYEELGFLIQKFVPAWRLEIEKFFALVVFNFLFSNGDAHLKNFALLESSGGDYLLSPAYDLINSRIHIDDTDFGLNRGLFADNYKSEGWKKKGHPTKMDFIEFGKRIGIQDKRIDRILTPFLEKIDRVTELVEHSFLEELEKRAYISHYNTRRNYLNYN